MSDKDATCKTCKWWGVHQQTPHGGTDAKNCGSPLLIDIDDHKQGYGAVQGSGFGLDYPVCDLVTGPDFGCVHWKPVRIDQNKVKR